MLWVYLAYLLGLAGAAHWISLRWQGLGEFFLAGRQLGSVLVAVSYVAAWFGAGSLFVTMETAYRQGLSAIWVIMVPTILSIGLVSWCFAKPVRESETESMPQAIEQHYGSGGGLILSLIILVSLIGFMASQLVAAIQLVTQTTPLTPWLSALLVMGSIVVYSAFGGFRAVVLTDWIHTLLCGTGLLVLFGSIGWGFWHQTPFLPVQASHWQVSTDWRLHLFSTITFVLAWSIQPEMWQRMSSTQRAKQSQAAAKWAGLLLVVLYTLVISIGLMASRVVEIPTGQSVLVSLAQTLPTPLIMLVLVGVLSALTSTIDSSLNVVTLTLVEDILYRRLIPTLTEARRLLLSRWLTPLIVVLPIALALYQPKIIELLWVSADIFACTMFVPIVAMFYAKPTSRKAGMAAMIAGGSFAGLTAAGGFHGLMLPTFWPTWPASTLCGVILSALVYAVVRLSETHGLAPSMMIEKDSP